MASASQLIIYFLLLLVVTVLVLYLLIGTLSGKATFISTRLEIAGRTLASLANSAIAEANSIVGQAFDFLNIVVHDINLVLQAIANSIAQIITTLGAALVDVINFIVVYFESSNAAIIDEINGFFDFIIQPIFDTINQGVATIISVGTTLYKTFDPTNC